MPLISTKQNNYNSILNLDFHIRNSDIDVLTAKLMTPLKWKISLALVYKKHLFCFHFLLVYSFIGDIIHPFKVLVFF